ncbi:MAG: hydrogenase maturation nickel metallochaperone HypA [Gemmatimonadetes bacterium]|nr:hydrogenase maturation nickel metallochaperone HypA [Gemmatimonadota bacterium]
MSMVRCRECGGEVSTEAVVCPHCGIRDPAVAGAPAAARHAPAAHPDAHPRRRGGRAGWMVALLLLLVLLALFALWYGNVVDFN